MRFRAERARPGLASALTAVAVAAAGCGSDGEVTRLDDAGFVTPDAAADVADTGGDAGPVEGCAILDLEDCADGRVCCALPLERCVPDASGGTECVAAGDVGEGEVCGSAGVDDCAVGLLCVAGVIGRTCQRLCAPGSDDCGDEACVLALEVGGEQVGLCL